MQELDAVETKQLEAILARLPDAHPARQARRKGLSLIPVRIAPPIGEVDTILSAITGWIEGLHK